jgi:hypothetical protein
MFVTWENKIKNILLKKTKTNTHAIRQGVKMNQKLCWYFKYFKPLEWGIIEIKVYVNLGLWFSLKVKYV